MHIYRIHIIGLVQGVGFRPFIYRIALEMHLNGEVHNNNEGVNIEIEASETDKNLFLKRIQNEKPFASDINKISVEVLDGIPYRKEFTISHSDSVSDRVTHVSPDIAVCTDCLNDMKQQVRRIDYPFINCTHCGPRFSIIRELPYDRTHTSMQPYSMCPECFEEYVKITDRRFHAQPTACNTCGPSYYLTQLNKEGTLLHNYVSPDHFFQRLAGHIENGELLSLKGLGGYNLICDAFNPRAVLQMRSLKKRDAKPFALMFRSENEVRKYMILSKEEEKALTSWQRPIVLLHRKPEKELNTSINGGLDTFGVVLPYLPAHYLLFEQLKTDALIFTSGNLHDEPIITDNQEASAKLLPECHLQGDHDREIVNRTDDSIIQLINDTPRILRRSRGYVPTTHKSALYMEGILAFGPEKVNTFAIGKDNEAILSQYIGDLKNIETLDFYKEAIRHFCRLFRFSPTTYVCDMHPDYFSTRHAAKLASESNGQLYMVQHHHAHAVACMEENHLSGNHLAIVLDGTGFGTDGKIWGGEFLICDHEQFSREAHLDYIPIPGGDKAIKEPWRLAIAFLEHYKIPIPAQIADLHAPEMELIRKMTRQQINAPQSCGAGRLFDAVSAMLGCCDIASFQAEAPLRLEHLAEDNYQLRYPIDELNPLKCCSLLNHIAEDVQKGVRTSLIAAKFHNTFAQQLLQQTELIFQKYDLPREVILTGGCFQNRRLSEQVEKGLTKRGFSPVVPQLYPANDGGISLGQICIAASLRKKEYA